LPIAAATQMHTSHRWLLAALLTATTLAPRAARAEDTAGIQYRGAYTLAKAASKLYDASGSPKAVEGRNCAQAYDSFRNYEGTDAYVIALPVAIKTPRVSWPKGEKHTVGELKALCDGVGGDDQRRVLLAEYANAARGVAERPEYIDQERVDKCLADYRDVHAAAITDADAVEIERAEDANPLRPGRHTVGEIHAFCLAQGELRAKRDLIAEQTSHLSGAVFDVLDTVKKAEASPHADLKMIDFYVQRCGAAVEAARAKGLTDDFAVDGQGLWKGTLGKIKQEVCDRGAASRQRLYDERFGPYLKAGLKQDKFSYLYGTYPDGALVGAGKWITDPHALMRSNVWFEIIRAAPDGTSQSCVADGAEVYTLRRLQFDASQKIAKTTERGFCGDPPASAYR
jgi:hypothetical protein